MTTPLIGGRLTRAKFVKWMLDPVLFSQHLLKQRTWSVQRAIMQSVATHKRTAVKGCHASSKTFTAAAVALWWLLHDERAVVVTTGPTWKQVLLGMWGEIGKAIARSVFGLPEPGRAQLWLARAGIDGALHDNYATGLSTNEADRFQGLPRLKTLIIVDEGPGVKPPIWTAMEGIRAGGDVRILALGNPTAIGSPFHDAFTTNRERWATHSIDALDTPNTRGLGRTPEERLEVIVRAYEKGDGELLSGKVVDFLVDREWIAEKYKEWGPTSPQWEARVRGQFPTHAEDAVFPLAWLERAMNTDLDDLPPAAFEATTQADFDVGIDPAGPGRDECAVTITQRYHIVAQAQFMDADPRGAVAKFLMPFRPKIRRLKIDTSGMGWFFAQHFKDLGYEVHMINAEGDPVFDRPDRSGRRKFANRKAEVYWNGRDLLEAGEVSGMKDQKTITQLSKIHWLPDSRGRIMIEPKDVAERERGLKSPDRGESWLLAVAPVREKKGDQLPPSVVIRSY